LWSLLSVGPLILLGTRDSLQSRHTVLRGIVLRDRIKLLASGKIFTGFHIIRALALVVDLCVSTRGMCWHRVASSCCAAIRITVPRG
jgi:glutamate synthase domain-containing protein 2